MRGKILDSCGNRFRQGRIGFDHAIFRHGSGVGILRMHHPFHADVDLQIDSRVERRDGGRALQHVGHGHEANRCLIHLMQARYTRRTHLPNQQCGTNRNEDEIHTGAETGHQRTCDQRPHARAQTIERRTC